MSLKRDNFILGSGAGVGLCNSISLLPWLNGTAIISIPCKSTTAPNRPSLEPARAAAEAKTLKTAQRLHTLNAARLEELISETGDTFCNRPSDAYYTDRVWRRDGRLGNRE
jgi:hypothetical protein